jgi:hypothetical protein
VKVVSVAQKKPKKYTVQCLRCGKTYITSGQALLNRCTGCHDCRVKDKLAERYKPYIGQRFGYLEVLGFAGQGVRGTALARCLCHKCGREIVTTYSRLLHSDIKMCAQCAQQNLYDGLAFHKKLIADGTDISALQRRNVNINSTTGHTGVSRMASGRYRAYINFKRHQYTLGCYDTIEEAAEARKAAEDKIYGNFIEWYKEAYPVEWETYIQKKRREMHV